MVRPHKTLHLLVFKVQWKMRSVPIGEYAITRRVCVSASQVMEVVMETTVPVLGEIVVIDYLILV